GLNVKLTAAIPPGDQPEPGETVAGDGGKDLREKKSAQTERPNDHGRIRMPFGGVSIAPTFGPRISRPRRLSPWISIRPVRRSFPASPGSRRRSTRAGEPFGRRALERKRPVTPSRWLAIPDWAVPRPAARW